MRPPSPLLALRVGVTGHRNERLAELGARTDDLRAAVRQVLAELRDVVREIHGDAGSIYSARPPELRLLSLLAEGADRFVAEEAIDLGYHLQCVLPFSPEEYEHDFDAPASREEFRRLLGQAERVLELPGDPDQRPAAYLAAGSILIQQCDVLLAVWDGDAPRRTGGTAQVAEEALGADVPTIHIGAHPSHEVKVAIPRRGEALAWSAALEPLAEHLRTILLPPEPAARVHLSAAGRLRRFFLPPPTPGRERVLRFRREHRPRLNFDIVFLAYELLWAGGCRRLRKLRLHVDVPRRPTPFEWADGLAKAYAGCYRSAFVLAFLTGAGAVVVAYFGVKLDQWGWFAAELALIAVILFITIRGRQQGWHERWIDYRLLAEALRQEALLAPIGRVPPAFKVPVHLRPGDPRPSWAHWYFHVLLRAKGLPAARLDGAYLGRYSEELQGKIAEQILYHRRTHRRYERLHHRQHFAAQWLFVLAAAGCVAHLTLKVSRESWVEKLLGFCALGLPAVGAAFASILHHGEFERLALRSGALGERLKELRDKPETASRELADLTRLADELCGVLMAEFVDWRSVFVDRELVLPA